MIRATSVAPGGRSKLAGFRMEDRRPFLCLHSREIGDRVLGPSRTEFSRKTRTLQDAAAAEPRVYRRQPPESPRDPGNAMRHLS